jgi:hypothetical protein
LPNHAPRQLHQCSCVVLPTFTPDRPLGLPGHAALDRSRPWVELPPTHGRAGCGQGPIPSPHPRCLTTRPHLRTSWINNGNLLDLLIYFVFDRAVGVPVGPTATSPFLGLRSLLESDIPSVLHSLLHRLTEEPSIRFNFSYPHISRCKKNLVFFLTL